MTASRGFKPGAPSSDESCVREAALMSRITASLIPVVFALTASLEGCALMGLEENREPLDPVAEAARVVREGRSPAASSADLESAQELAQARIRLAVSY